MFKKLLKNHLSLLLILTLALPVRLYKLKNPIADWHSWRQADTASVTRIFSQEGVNLLIPRFQDISNIPSGLENPQGYRMVEFPLYNLFHLTIFKITGLNLDIAGRLTSVTLSLVSLVLLYFIALKISGKKTAILSTIFFALLPFNIFYSRVILPEPLMVTLFLASFLLLLSLSLWSSAVFFALALLVKPYAIFFSLPFALIFWQNIKAKKINFRQLLLYWFIVFAPLILWRLWINNFPAGIPAYKWLFNQNGIRFRPAWFRWLFAERLAKLILGYWGGVFLILGLLKKPVKTLSWSYLLFGLGILIYFSILASGNITHDYYQAITLPFISLLLGRGVTAFTSLPRTSFSQLSLSITSLIIILLSLAFSWYEVKGLYQINNPNIIEAGRAADRLLSQTAKVIAPYQGDTAFLYQINRYGWPAITHDIDKMISLGATHYVSVNFDRDTNNLIQNPRFKTLKATDRFIILELK